MKKANKKTAAATKVKVLYQNLNGIWYAFAQVGGEVFYTPVDYKTIQQKTPSTEDSTSESRRKKIAAIAGMTI
jgi:hypothetical protein